MSATLLLHGPLEGLSSFSLVNRKLAAGLAAEGWSVSTCASDGSATSAPTFGPPDVHLFHGHPYDATTAPGRTNAFFLSYDYAAFIPADRHLAAQLNRNFDIVVTPSRFSARACRRSGVTAPISVCPYGVDAREFHPNVEPLPIPGRRRFCFLALGGATERKGTELLLDAYSREFSKDDDVTLVVKAFSYQHLMPWVAAALERAHRSPRAPHIVFDNTEPASIAGYFAAADAGVFPFRGEGFGLPILECLASGRPAIVSRAGGPLDFGRVGVTWLPVAPRERHGKAQVEPDRQALRQLLRQAVERGPLSPTQQQRIAAHAATYSWTRCTARLTQLLTSARTPGRRRRALSTTARTAYVFLGHGSTSWRQHSVQVDRALTARDQSHVSISTQRPAHVPPARIVVGQSGFCVEAFLASGMASRRVLHRESAPLDQIAAILNRERARCGLPPERMAPMALWRDRMEASLADRIVVTSQCSRQHFVDAGFDPRRLRVIWPGITPARQLPPRRTSSPRLLFVASNPFRKGIRVLLEAWRQVRNPKAELLCVCPRETLASAFVLRHLTMDARITVEPFTSHRRFLSRYAEADALVLPSFEEGFPYAVADGMARGLPAIVSTTAGIDEAITHEMNGLIVESGAVRTLADAMERLLDDAPYRRRLGEAAYARSRVITWAEFRRRWSLVLDELEAL
ncbi:MAG: glycosyltransferase [Vicinamibacterales bacterium]